MPETRTAINVASPTATPTLPPAVEAAAVARCNTSGRIVRMMRAGGVKVKTHAVLVSDYGSDTDAVNLHVFLDAAPPGCTANEVGTGGIVHTVMGGHVPAGDGRFTDRFDVTFTCPADPALIGQDFVLRAHVDLVTGTDVDLTNNDLVKTQTVR